MTHYIAGNVLVTLNTDTNTQIQTEIREDQVNVIITKLSAEAMEAVNKQLQQNAAPADQATFDAAKKQVLDFMSGKKGFETFDSKLITPQEQPIEPVAPEQTEGNVVPQ